VKTTSTTTPSTTTIITTNKLQQIHFVSPANISRVISGMTGPPRSELW